MKKDDLIEVTIEDLSEEGTGIGKFEGMTFFIKDAVIGDRVRAKIMKMKKNYGFARLMEVLTPSPDRVEPLCPVARQCGGCQIQAMSYEAQLAFKTRKVESNLKRIGKFEEIPMESIIGMGGSFSLSEQGPVPLWKKPGRENHHRLLRRSDPQHHREYELPSGKRSQRGDSGKNPRLDERFPCGTLQ